MIFKLFYKVFMSLLLDAATRNTYF